MYSRLPIITSLLTTIAQADSTTLACMIATSYRIHYKQLSVGMCWSHPLPTLQLVGVCIGGIVLAHICRAMAVNYKYLGSGLPDLLLIRLKSRGENRGSGDSSSTVAYKSVGGGSECTRGGVGNGADGEGECIDLSVALGESWERLGGTLAASENKGRGRDDGELLQHSYRPTDKATRTKIGSATVGYAEEVELDDIGDDGEIGTSDSNTTTIVDPFTYLGPHLTVYSYSIPTATTTTSPATTTSITSPVTTTTSDGVTCHVWDKYTCAAMFVEVKGPGDKLAPYQLLWQHILHNSGAHSIVGYVREEKIAGKIGMKLNSSGRSSATGNECDSDSSSSDDYSGHAYEN